MNRKIFLALGLSLLAMIKLSGQGLNCGTSDPFCTGTIYNFPAGTSGDAEIGPDYGCLYTQPAPAWYHMRIGNSGPIAIYMYSTPLEDIDFICWGPFSDPFAQCPYGLTSSTIIDCSYSALSYETCDIPNGQTGQYYILLITNYSEDPCNITFSQTGGSGSTDCTILPPPVSNNGPLCVGEMLNLSAEFVTNATYAWTGPNGFTSSQQNPVIPNVTLANAGDYSCVITVGGQSSSPAITTVVINNRPTASLISNDTTVCTGNVAYAIMNFTGMGPFEVSYSNGVSTFTATGLTGAQDTIFLYPTGTTTYTFLTVTDQNCDNQLTGVQLVVNTYPLTSGSLTGSTSICSGQSAQLTFSLTGTPPWTVTYTTNGANPQQFNTNASPYILTVNPTVTTTYALTFIQDLYCSSQPSSQAVVTVNASPTVNAGTDQTIPYGTSTVLHGQVSGGSGSYQYAWVPANKLVNPTVLEPTTVNLFVSTLFTLTATDNAGGCFNSDAVMVTITGSVLSCFPEAHPPIVCAGDQSQLFAMAAGGSGNYTYQWSSNPPGFNSTLPNPFVNPSLTTVYTVQVNDGSNLTSGNVTVTVRPRPVPNAGDDITIPYGTTTILQGSATNGSGSYIFHWEPADLLVNPDIAHPQTVNLYSTTAFTLFVTDAIYGCQAASPDQMTVFITGSALAANPLAVPDEICLGESAQLFANASGGAGTYTYSWSSNPPGFSSTLPNPLVTPAQTAIYTVIVSDGYNITSGNVTLTVFQQPVTDAGDDISIPYGTSTVLYGQVSGGSGNYQYEWEPAGKLINPNVQQPTTVNLNESTLFTLTATDNVGGCYDSDDVLVTVSGGALGCFPSAYPPSICSGGSSQLAPHAAGGSGSYTYQWSSNPPGFNSTLPEPVVTPIQTTVYTVQVDDGFNVISGNTTVTVYPLPVVDAGDDTTIPVGTSTVLHGQASGGSGNYQYAWEPAGKLVNPGIQQPTTVNLNESTLFTLTVTDNVGGCYDTDDIFVTVSGGALGCYPSAHPPAICAGEISQLVPHATGGSGSYSFLWSSNPPGFSSTLEIPVVTPVQNTVYTVIVNDGYNVTTGNATVNVHQLPVPEAGTDIVIPHGANTVLQGSASGGSGSYSYHWEPADKLLNPYNPNAETIKLFSSTLFTLYVTDLTFGCQAASPDQMTVIVSGDVLAVNPAVSPDEICLNESAQLFAVPGGGAGNYTYSWTLNDVFFSSEPNPWITPQASSSFTYTCAVNDGFNTALGSVTINVLALPFIDFGFGDTTVCVYDSVILDAGNPGSSYIWSNGSTERTIKASTIGIGFDMQTHSVTVTNQSGCQSDLSVSIIFDFTACTGVGGVETAQFCRVYPNPGDGTLHLLFQQGVKKAVVSVSNLVGQNIWGPYQFNDLKVNGEVIINLGRKTEGVYFIHINSGDSDLYTFKYILGR